MFSFDFCGLIPVPYSLERDLILMNQRIHCFYFFDEFFRFQSFWKTVFLVLGFF
jgi:hypothetical protein